MKTCPHCLESVNDKATRCPHCTGKMLLPGQWSWNQKMLLVVLVLFVLAFFWMRANDSAAERLNELLK